MSEILEREKVIKKEIKILEDIYSKQENTSSPLSLQLRVNISDKKVELADINLEKVIKESDINLYFLNNYSDFADSNIRENISKLEKQFAEENRKQQKLKELKEETETELDNFFSQEYYKRVNFLNFFDFLYYSIGISTTTTFGDIVANTRSVRSFVSLQLFISVIILSAFVEEVTK